MAEVLAFQPGNYRYIEAVFQYSGGIAAERGYEIERARFIKPLPLRDAYAAVETHLTSIGRPSTAFAACELRSPEPFTDQGFYEFNKTYVTTLERWGIYKSGEPPVNPVARTNVCPVYDKPAEPVMYAFSYSVPQQPGKSTARGSFILSGSGDARASGNTYRDRIVRPDDTSPEALREKVRFVVAEMEQRLALLGFSWKDAVAVQAYTVQNIGHLVGEELAARGAGALTWHYARPPVIGLEYEMDVHAPARVLLI
ncbi:MAG: hypothetical protein JWN13_6738 [Betaproteobacteria bacterium]|jgi:hypothetical protein|nr:hypothetical protein [Betaproteobacteria bacterium]